MFSFELVKFISPIKFFIDVLNPANLEKKVGKVSFANEISLFAKQIGADYDKVIEYAKHDDRLGYSHWNVPGPDGDFGYGGHCFPKDVKAFIKTAQKHDLLVSLHHQIGRAHV